MSNAAKSFDILISLSILHYFDGTTKLFLDVYRALLNTSAKLYFLYIT